MKKWGERHAYWKHNPTIHMSCRLRENEGYFLRRQGGRDAQKYERAAPMWGRIIILQTATEKSKT